MTPQTIHSLAAVIKAQASTNMSAISTMIEVIKLFPAGPAREPAIERLADLVERSQEVNSVAESLVEALLVEAQNAARS